MEAILISIKPKWVAKILNGEKTIEIRKTMPKCELPIDVYIYCTKENAKYYIKNKIYKSMMNGKVVAKFTLNKVEEYINGHKMENLKENIGSCIDYEKVLKPSCLTDNELYAYADDLHFFAWHISNLVIFDKPKELSEFNKYGCKQYDNDVCETYGERGHLYTNCFFHLTKAPQSWCYIETGE